MIRHDAVPCTGPWEEVKVRSVGTLTRDVRRRVEWIQAMLLFNGNLYLFLRMSRSSAVVST